MDYPLFQFWSFEYIQWSTVIENALHSQYFELEKKLLLPKFNLMRYLQLFEKIMRFYSCPLFCIFWAVGLKSNFDFAFTGLLGDIGISLSCLNLDFGSLGLDLTIPELG